MVSLDLLVFEDWFFSSEVGVGPGLEEGEGQGVEFRRERREPRRGELA